MADDEPTSASERRSLEMKEIGQAVKRVRTGRGWSLRRLADEAGVSASLLSSVETGKIVPTVGSLFAISDALGERTETFFPLRRRAVDAEVHRPAEDGRGVDPGEGHANPTTGSDSLAVGPNSPTPAASVPSRSRTTESAPVPTSGDAVELANEGSLAFRLSRRRPEVVHRHRSRSSTFNLKGKVQPAGPAPRHDLAGEPPAGQAASDREPVVVSLATPGVSVRRADERPTMLLEDGTTWSLPISISGEIGQVMETTIPAATAPPARYRLRDRPTSVMVTQGRLRIDAAFVETELGAGDSAVISAGVPHRLVGFGETRVTFLVFVTGEWDGRL